MSATVAWSIPLTLATVVTSSPSLVWPLIAFIVLTQEREHGAYWTS